jgi:hypothetical protein
VGPFDVHKISLKVKGLVPENQSPGIVLKSCAIEQQDSMIQKQKKIADFGI